MAEALAPTEPRERPILFKGRLVRAILDGTKSQTRRLVKNLKVRLPYEVKSDLADLMPWSRLVAKPGGHRAEMNPHGAVSVRVDDQLLGVKPGEFDFVCPYALGTTRLVEHVWRIEPHGSQRLWVRETWSTGVACKCASCRSFADEPGGVKYKASWCGGSYVDRWHPSIHMPRKFSRIMLEVTGVRVERLHAITEADALAEGISRHGGYFDGAPHKVKGTPRCMPTARAAFADLWAHINGAEAWEANPWVWVIDFRRLADGR